ncbi:hypothetical protein BK128_09685 [Viridibacillus sp. FSL H7-0596]|uniref:hypothetical protein n=1 Tax=Viridibacillus sp. FSL H7-0596 TaxID=1928923 RepID=UPI00096EF302|nr:hypothetical protein [Viridibacillus sp. FSL H7-0596]OMC86925.1 hypothetical protein BK128_09685 [Viridibacillus sp. FSL H7-0596]
MWQPTTEQVALFKGLNGEKSTKKDSYYIAMLPIVLERANEHCNQTFKPESLPGGVQIFIAKVLQFNEQKAGLSSRSMGTVSYSFEAEIPQSLYKHLAPFRKLRW